MLLNEASVIEKIEKLSPSGSPSDKKSPSKFSGVCVVCGDLSTGYHYEVSSCNGCKTFFRRTIIAHRTYKCHKNGNCVFNKDIRCACRACRFSKCLRVGMNPKAIQCNRTGRIASPVSRGTPADIASSLTSALQPLLQSALSARGSPSSVSPGPHTVSCASSPNPETSNLKRAYTVSALLDLPYPTSPTSSKEAQEFSHSLSPSSAKFADESDELPHKRARSDASEKLIAHLLSSQERLQQLMGTEYEASTSILELLTRPCAMDEIGDYSRKEETSVVDAADALNLNVALEVEYAKSFEVFRKMPLEDKFFLLRDVTLVLCVFESAYQCFVKGRSATLLNTKDDSARAVAFDENSASAILLAIESVNRAELERSEFVLLKAIVFLHAECFGLSSSSYKQLAEKRQLVLDALFDYMMSTHGKQGPVKYGNVLSISWTLFKAAQRFKEALSALELEPLCEEILSSKMPVPLV